MLCIDGPDRPATRNDRLIKAAAAAFDVMQSHFVAAVPIQPVDGVDDHAAKTFDGIARTGWELLSTAAEGGFLIATFRRVVG